MQHRLWPQPRNAGAFGPKADKDAGHARRRCGLAVGVGIPDQDRARRVPPRQPHRCQIGRRVGLARGQRISPDQRPEQIAHAQPLHQCLGQPLGLVGADRRREASRAQRHNRIGGTGIETGMCVNRISIGRQQHRILRIHRRLIPLPEPREPKPKHGATTVKGGQRIAHRIKQITMAKTTKAGIRRRDQICRGIGQSAVQIENHRFHGLETCRKDV